MRQSSYCINTRAHNALGRFLNYISCYVKERTNERTNFDLIILHIYLFFFFFKKTVLFHRFWIVLFETVYKTNGYLLSDLSSFLLIPPGIMTILSHNLNFIIKNCKLDFELFAFEQFIEHITIKNWKKMSSFQKEISLIKMKILLFDEIDIDNNIRIYSLPNGQFELLTMELCCSWCCFMCYSSFSSFSSHQLPSVHPSYSISTIHCLREPFC